MMLEVFITFLITIAGATAVFAIGVRKWYGILGLGFIAGLCLLIILGTLQLILRMPTTPYIALVILGLFTVGYWIRYTLINRKSMTRKAPLRLLMYVLCIGLFLTLFYAVVSPLIFIRHVDSFEYIAIGSILESSTFHESVSLYQFQKRMLAVPFMHAAANIFDGSLYLKIITPLLALAMLGSMVWLWLKGVAGTKLAGHGKLVLIGVIGVVLLITNRQFLVHATYVNGHLLFGALLMLVAGSAWLLASKKISTRVFIGLQAIVIPALIVTRPEASMVVGLALLPLLANVKLDFLPKAAALGILGISIILWQGLVCYLYMVLEGRDLPIIGDGRSIPLSAWGLMGIGFAAIAAIPILKTKLYNRFAKALPHLVEVGLWVVLGVLALLKPETIMMSVQATVQNIAGGFGSWGYSWILLALLFAAALVLVKTKHGIYLRYAVTTFVPLAFVLAYLREGAYRVGTSDSLNRMWMEIIPLALLLVMYAATTGVWRFSRKRRKASRKKVT
jgi:hypothetical protein